MSETTKTESQKLGEQILESLRKQGVQFRANSKNLTNRMYQTSIKSSKKLLNVKLISRIFIVMVLL